MSLFLPSTKYINVTRTVTGSVAVEDSDLVLDCDTSLAPVIVDLKQIPEKHWSTLYKLYVKDFGNNASVNNITIVAPTGYTINNQSSVVINVNSGCCIIRIGSNVDYVGTFSYTLTVNSPIIVENTVYVMKNGSDSTGLIERFDKPFLTIEAATSAAVAGFISRTVTDRVKVIVESGNYTDVISLYPYIDYELGNSVITAKAGSPNITDINGTFTAQSNGEYTNIIYGNATFLNSSSFSGFNAHNSYFSKSSTVLINALSFYTQNGECAYVTNGSKIDFYVRTMKASNVSNSSIINTIQVYGTSGQQPCIITINNSYLSNEAVLNQKSVVMVTNALGVTNLYHKVALINCQLQNYSTTEAAIQAFESSPQGDLILTLNSSIIYCSNAVPSISKGNSGCNLNVYIYNSYANRALDAATLAPTVIYGTLNVDSNIIVNQGQPI